MSKPNDQMMEYWTIYGNFTPVLCVGFRVYFQSAWISNTHFFYKNNFIRTSRLKIAKNKEQTKNNPSLRINGTI